MLSIYEGRVQHNGSPVPIHCLDLKLQDVHPSKVLHYHDYIELIYCVEGALSIVLDTQTHVLSAGDMVLIHGNQPHDAYCKNQSCRIFVLKFLPQVLRAEEETVSEYACVNLLMEQAVETQFLFSAAELKHTDLPALFHHAVSEWEGKPFGYELSLRADVTRIYLHILRQWFEKNRSFLENIQKNRQSDFVRAAVSYIRAHFVNLTEGDVAAVCGMSTAYFSRLFKRAMKVSFSEYVTTVRLKESERLLLLTDESMTSIAQLVGFSTVSYFISRFKHTHGVTPYQYRRLHRA